MKKTLLIATIFFAFLLPNVGRAASFTTQHDTINITVTGSAAIFNDIINLTSSGLVLNWHVTGTNFPHDWLSASAFGICDNVTCYSNNNDMHLWNDTTHVGQSFTTAAYDPSTTTGPFDLALNLTGTTSSGCYWVTINLAQTGLGTSKDITFIVCKFPTAVQNTVTVNEVKLYPNPASDHATLEVTLANASQEAAITVMDQLGRVVSSKKEILSSGKNTVDINTALFAPGFYHVSVRTSEGLFTRALTISR